MFGGEGVVWVDSMCCQVLGAGFSLGWSGPQWGISETD